MSFEVRKERKINCKKKKKINWPPTFTFCGNLVNHVSENDDVKEVFSWLVALKKNSQMNTCI